MKEFFHKKERTNLYKKFAKTGRLKK